MSGTVMKFGPQWIRTLTDGAAPSTPNSNNNSTQNNNNSNSTTSTSSTSSSSAAVNNYHNNNPSLYNNSSSNNGIASASTGATSSGKYKLAEYRYGREEMLALFEPNMEAPDDIKNFTGLYVEKARMPMAMTQMSEEEVKLSTRTWNSDQVLRSVSKAAGAAAGGSAVGVGPGANHIGGISGAGGGLGGHANFGSTMNDRDSKQMSERGAMTAAEVLSSSPRGPPGAMSRVPLGEQRGLLSSIGSRAPPSTIRSLVGRGANLYMRSQSHDDEGVGTSDGLGTGTSSAGIGGGSGPGGFEGRFGLSGQARQPSSLRARFENSRAPAIGAGPGMPNSSKIIDIKSGIDTELPPQGRSVFDRLPSKHNADEKLIRKDINGRPMPSDWRSRDWSGSSGPEGARSAPKGIGPPDEGRSWRSTRTGGAQTAEDWRSGSGQNAGPGTAGSQSSWYVRTDDQRNLRQHLPQNQENLNPSSGGKRDTLRRPSVDDKHGDDDDDNTNQPRHRRDSLPEWSIGDLSGDKVGSFDATGNFRSEPRDDGGNLLNNKMKAPEKQHQQQQLNQSKRQQDHQRDQLQANDFEHLERAAEIMVEKWTAEEDQHEHKSSMSPDFLRNKANLNSREHHDAQHANILQNNSIDNRKSSQVQQHRQEHHQSGLESNVGGSGNAGNEFGSANNQQKIILLPSNHEDAQQWYYRDTQSVVQGPFSPNDMFEWYKAGYFVKELMVRRACDELFYLLGDVIKMWNRIPFAPIPADMAHPPPITSQLILQFRAMQKQLQMAAASEARIPPNAFDVPPGTVLLPGQLLQQQSIHPVLAAASMNQNAMAPPDQQANIRQIIEAATRQQQQRQQEQHEPAILQQQQQQRNMPVNVPDTNEMQAQLRQLLVQLKNREGFLNLNAQQQQEVLVRQFVATRATMGQNNVASGNSNALQEQEHQALLQQQQHRAGLIPFMPSFLSNDQQERLRFQQELERRQKEEVDKQQQQTRLIMEQRMEVEKEKQRLMEEVQKQRQKKQLEESEKQKQEAEEDRIRKLNMLKQQQLAKQHEEFKQQLQNQQRIQMEQQQQKKQQQQQQAQQQQQQAQQPQATPLSTIQQQQQQQIERAKKAAQAHQVQQEQQQQQHQRKTAWSVSKPETEPVSLASLQKQQEEEKERERERQRQQQAQLNQQHQQQQINFQRQMTWANAAQQPKPAPVKTLAEIQKEEEERLAREKQRKAKVQPVVASAGVWNNAASHLSWKNPPSDS